MGSSHNTGLCEKIFAVISCGPRHHQHDDESSGWVPIVFDDHAHQAMLRKPSFEGKNPNNQIRTRVFSEYIERAGTVIRAGSNVGRRPAMRRESIDTRVTRFIGRNKHKFTTKASFVE